MPRIRHDHQIAVGQSFGQFPGTAGWADDIVATLNNGGRDMLYLVDIVEDMAFLNENRIDEIMAFDSGEGDRKIEVFMINMTNRCREPQQNQTWKGSATRWSQWRPNVAANFGMRP